jgi:hypothetical protein
MSRFPLMSFNNLLSFEIVARKVQQDLTGLQKYLIWHLTFGYFIYVPSPGQVTPPSTLPGITVYFRGCYLACDPNNLVDIIDQYSSRLGASHFVKHGSLCLCALMFYHLC